jgi:hypothetical protein
MKTTSTTTVFIFYYEMFHMAIMVWKATTLQSAAPLYGSSIHPSGIDNGTIWNAGVSTILPWQHTYPAGFVVPCRHGLWDLKVWRCIRHDHKGIHSSIMLRNACWLACARSRSEASGIAPWSRSGLVEYSRLWIILCGLVGDMLASIVRKGTVERPRKTDSRRSMIHFYFVDLVDSTLKATLS